MTPGTAPAGAFLTMRLPRFAFRLWVLLSVFWSAAGNAGWPRWLTSRPPRPADVLDAEGATLAEAQAAYMWAHGLAQSPDTQHEAATWYARAIDARPNDDPPLAEFLGLWSPGRRAAAVRHYLKPVARRHPQATNLNLAVARAHLELGEDRAALQRLWRLEPTNRRQATVLVHEQTMAYRRCGHLRRAHELLTGATTGPLANDFLAHYTATVFYDQVAYATDTRLTLHTRYDWQVLAYRHAVAATALPVAAADTQRVVGLAGFLLAADFVEYATAMLERLHATDAPLYQYGEILARCRERLGDLGGAADLWQELARQLPGFTAYSYAEARLRLALGELTAAEAAARRAHRRAPRDIPTIALLAETLATAGTDLEEAQTLIETALAAVPDDAGYLATAAWITWQRGAADRARHLMEKALHLQGTAADLRTRQRAAAMGIAE